MKRLALLLTALPLPIFLDELPTPKFAVVHVDQPIVKPAMIQGVPYDHRLPGPVNWFRCPSCYSSTDLMYLGQHLRSEHKVSDAELDQVGRARWSLLDDNLHNKGWKPSKADKAVPQQGGCEGGTCRRPVRSFLLKR